MDDAALPMDPVDWVVGVLRSHGMPPEEILALTSAEDPELVRRHLELHRERLDEGLAERRRALAELQPLLARAAAERGRARIGGS